jgi:anaerobic selenocysteine-containing dehydrogenase
MTTTPNEPRGEEQIHYRTCPLCEATCGLEMTVRDGRVASVRGDEQDVFSKGYLCPKGANLAALHEDPDRLRTPMIREGTGWREVGYDEAFAEIERRLLPILERGGRNALGVYLGNPNVHNLGGALYLRPLLKAFRTKQIFSASTVDQMPTHVACGLMYGSPGAIPVPDVDRCDYLLMIGANPLESNGSLWTAPNLPGRLRELRRRGGKLIVVDPRKTRTAELADTHLAIRPSTDVYLLLGLCHVLFEEGLVRLGAAEHLVSGLDEVREWVKPFDPASVAARTGIDAETVCTMARELAAAEHACVYAHLGALTVRFGTLSIWAAELLTILSGHLDQPGGKMWTKPPHQRVRKGGPGKGFRMGRWQSRVRGLPEVLGELPVSTLSDEIETEGEGQIRAMICVSGNPVLSTPNGGRLAKALESLDFMVSVDLYLNETSRYADVILPVPSPLERSHFDLALYNLAIRNVGNYSPALFETDMPQESEVLARLALIGMGQGAKADPGLVHDALLGGVIDAALHDEASPLSGSNGDALREEVGGRAGPERILDILLRSGAFGDDAALSKFEASPHGIDFGPLEPRLPDILNTPSGTIELAAEPIATDMERLYADWDSPPDERMLLIGRRDVRSNNSWMHNIEKLVSGRDRCTLLVHPDDADRLGLADGRKASVTSRVGRVEVPVERCPEIRPGVVSLPHGWGHGQPGTRLTVAAGAAGVNSNLLTDEAEMDVLSGNAVLNGIPVEIVPLG